MRLTLFLVGITLVIYALYQHEVAVGVAGGLITSGACETFQTCGWPAIVEFFGRFRS